MCKHLPSRNLCFPSEIPHASKGVKGMLHGLPEGKRKKVAA